MRAGVRGGGGGRGEHTAWHASHALGKQPAWANRSGISPEASRSLTNTSIFSSTIWLSVSRKSRPSPFRPAAASVGQHASVSRKSRPSPFRPAAASAWQWAQLGARGQHMGPHPQRSHLAPLPSRPCSCTPALAPMPPCPRALVLSCTPALAPLPFCPRALVLAPLPSRACPPARLYIFCRSSLKLLRL